VAQIELLQMQSYPKFPNEIGVPIVRVGCREFECIGAMPPQDQPHIYLNMGEMRVASSAPIAPRYSISIRVWAHMKLIRQIVLTVTWAELKKQQSRFSRRYNGHSPCADFDLLPYSQRGLSGSSLRR
jgi:uncharacterized Zn-finger protein